ncbi:D-allose transporter substrate-binding protein [Silvimonas sp. JCM 19000]
MKQFKKMTLALTGAMLISGMAQAADVAMVLKTLSGPYWVSMRDGIQAEAKKRNVQVDILAPASEDDLQGQQRLVEDVVNKSYKGIGVAPISPVNLVQAIARANKKGTYVVNIDEKVDVNQLRALGGSVVGFASTDNVALGEKAGKYIASLLGKGPHKVAVIEGKAGNVSGDARRTGVDKAFKDAGITVVSSQPADWDRAKALDVVTNILQRNPDLNAIYAANDTMALGAVQAVKNAGKLGKVIVVGTDGVPEALDSVKRGELTATVAQNPAAIGAKCLDMLLDAVAKKPPMDPKAEPNFAPVDSYVVNKSGRVN